MPRLVLAACLACLTCGAGWADGDKIWNLDIPRQNVSAALAALAQQTRSQLLFPYEKVKSLEANALHGRYTLPQALENLLRGTGLAGGITESGVITISLEKLAAGRDQGEAMNGKSKKGNMPAGRGESVKKRRFLAGLIAAVLGSSATDARAEQGVESRSNTKLEEIIVTAQKREENLMDVPVPVTAISADMLVDSNQLRLQEYYTRIPGLSVAYDGIRGGLPTLSIRGVTTSALDNPAVAILVDDLPYGSATSNGGGSWVPDIDPSDLERVEVLRGPQGTLYGASSMGGLVKFVTVDPSTDGVSGRVQGGINSVYNGDGLGYSVRGAANVPLSDTLAVRASGFTRRDPGYIDDPELGIDGVNETDVYGGRLSALWRPWEKFSLKLSALLQDSELDGSSHVHPALGDLQQSALRGTGWVDREAEVYDATLTAKLGRVDLTSVSGYSINTLSDSVDLTSFFGPVAETLFGVGGSSVEEDIKTKKFTQEIRLSIPIGERLVWLFGAFYADEDSEFLQPIPAVDPATGESVGLLLSTSTLTTFEEYAAFTNLTWTVTDRFDIQLGGRFSENKKTGTQISAGALVGGESVLEVDAKDDAFTYLVTPRFKVSPNLMVYARLASGYRAGGVNMQSAVVPELPPDYEPDETQNYEVGVKGAVFVFGHALSLDASLYYIDWKDLQLSLGHESGAGFIDNGGGAKSLGVELSVEARPLTGLTIAAWFAWNEAELTEDFPPTSFVRGVDGDRLPFSSRFSGNFSLDQEFSLTNNVTGFIGGSVSYVGNRKGGFTGSPERQTFGDYTKLDLRAGLRYDSWTVNLFANNVTDERGELSGGFGSFFPFAFSYIQPRTVGLSIAKEF